jgi:hypothetical protein
MGVPAKPFVKGRLLAKCSDSRVGNLAQCLSLVRIMMSNHELLAGKAVWIVVLGLNLGLCWIAILHLCNDPPIGRLYFT